MAQLSVLFASFQLTDLSGIHQQVKSTMPRVFACENEGECTVYDFLNSPVMSTITVTIWTTFVGVAGSAYWGAIDGLIGLAKDLDL